MRYIVLGYARFTAEAPNRYWCQPLEADKTEVEQVDGPFPSLKEALFELERTLKPGWYTRTVKNPPKGVALLLEVRMRTG